MSFGLLPAIFIIWRFVDFAAAYFAPRFIPYLGQFSYVTDLTKSKLPGFIYSWANFDGMFMLRISDKGYQQSEQAFFPLYPLMIKCIHYFSGLDRIIIGIIISNVAFFTALYFLSKYIGNKKIFLWTLLFIIFFPVSYYFGALYTESTFFLWVILTIYYLKKKKYFLVLIFSYLAALTRLQGILLIIPIAVDIISQIKTKNKFRYADILRCLFPALGLITYMIYMKGKFNNPLIFLSSHTVFDQGRSGGIILLPQIYYRYIKIFLIANHDFAYFRALFEIASFTAVFAVLIYIIYKLYRQNKLLSYYSGLNLFVLAYLLMPTVSGTFLSIPRMILLCLPLFIFLAEIKNKSIKISLLIFFGTAHIFLLMLFIQGYFIS